MAATNPSATSRTAKPQTSYRVPTVVQPPAPVVTADMRPHTISEIPNTTGSTTHDSTPTAVTVTNAQDVVISLVSATWSGGTTLPNGLTTVLADALSPTRRVARVRMAPASIPPDWVAFSAPDNNFDFLAANETLTVVYNVTVTGTSGPSATQPVTIVVTGTNDAPVITAHTDGAVTEDVAVDGGGNLHASGTVSFTNVDQNDTHTVSATPVANGYLGTFTPTITRPPVASPAASAGPSRFPTMPPNSWPRARP